MGIFSEAHICQCLSRITTLRRNSNVMITGNRRKTGEKFVEDVLGLARGLIEVVGLKPGEIVAISALNSDLYLEWLLAVTFVGGIAAPLNYRWSLEEAKSAMDVVRPILLVTDTSSSYWHSKFQADSVSSLRWHILMNNSKGFDISRNILTTEALKKPSPKSQSLNYICGPEGAAIICFTSGTTGKPKGVTLSHSAFIVQSLAKIAAVGYGEDDVYLHTAPLCHIGGLSSAMAMLMVGGCHVILPKFEAKSALEAIEQHHVTSLIIVPAMLADIISSIRMKKETWKGLVTVKKILNGGGSLSVELLENAPKIFPRSKILSAYGMTEACSSLTFKTLYDPTRENSDQTFKKNGEAKSIFDSQPGGVCVGKTAPHVELSIVSDDSSHVGRILMRGPHAMLGYWGQISTKESDHGDGGWFDTGDIGRLDTDGNVWLVGRSKGRIKSGGENVYPEEVEAVLLKHPGVARVVVVGLPDARFTEMVVACIHLKEDWKWADYKSDHFAKYNHQCLSMEILQNFCKEESLTGFKIPKAFIIWRKPLPLTTTGKLRRDQLRIEVMSYMKLSSSRL